MFPVILQIILSVLLAFLIVDIVFLIISWWTRYSINPFFLSSSKKIYPMEITYPSVSQQQGILLDVYFNVESDKPIAEGVNVTIANPIIVLFTGTDSYKVESHNIIEVEIGFRNAQPSFSMSMGITDKVTGQHQDFSYKTISGASLWLTGKIDDKEVVQFNKFESRHNVPFNFPVAGDYSPSIVIVYQNGSRILYTDHEVKFHVCSPSELQTQLFNQLIVLLTLALVIFSFILILTR